LLSVYTTSMATISALSNTSKTPLRSRKEHQMQLNRKTKSEGSYATTSRRKTVSRWSDLPKKRETYRKSKRSLIATSDLNS
jgi:hypothetical protein